MNKIYLFILVIAVFLVIFGITNNQVFTVEHWLDYAEEAGDNTVPSLTGGYDFSGGFVDGSLAVAYVISYPIRFAWWFLQQFVLFSSYVFGGAII